MSNKRYSSYPSGFDAGLLVREHLHTDAQPRRELYVGNNSTKLPNERVKENTTTAGTFLRPFSTLDYAIGQAKAGDVIFVRPNHTETVTAAAGIDVDVDGIAIIGLGRGDDRPTITFTTSTAASLHLDADNVVLRNLLFVNDIDQQNHMIDIATASTTAKDCLIDNCEFREGTAKQALSFITADAADNCADRLQIRNCRMYAPTAGDANNAIEIAKDMDGVRLDNLEIYGDFDDAAINIPAGGNAQVDLIISNSRITNLLAGAYAIQINGTASTGKITDVYVETNALATAVDAGGLEMYNVLHHDGTDQGAASPIVSTVLIDDANNILGVDDANNVFASTNVVANADGSIIERQEYVQANMELPTDDGKVFMVTKNLTSSAILTTGVDVTGVASGDVLIEDIIMETDGTGLAAGTNFTIEKDGGKGLLTFFSEAVANLGANKTEVLSTGSVVASNGTVLQSGQKLVAKCTASNCTGSGVITLYLKCKRIADASTVAAA